MGWTATVTNKGYALQAKLLSTDKLVITRAVSGSGSCSTTQLINQTAVTGIKQELTIVSLGYDSNGNAKLKVTLSNIDLEDSYNVSQIGIYATDPDDGEILYAITQTDDAEPVPSITEQPNGFDCSWEFTLTYSNAANIDVTIDPSNAITQKMADERYVQISNIGENLSVDKNGVLSADAQEITVDDTLDDESTNPIQNKAVYEAIEDSKYTHPVHTTHSSGLYKVTVDSQGHVTEATAVQKSDIVDLGIPSSDTTYGEATSTVAGLMSADDKKKLSALIGGITDTKNTAGTTDTSEKIFLVGATKQASSAQTYSHDTCYIGTDGCLYSNNTKVSDETHCNHEKLNVGSYNTNIVQGCAIGSNNDFSGSYSLAVGVSNTVGQQAVALGKNCDAHYYQVVVGLSADTSTKEKGACNEITTSGSLFVVGNGISSSDNSWTRANAFRVARTGKCYGVNSFTSSGADYAEYMEWEDGNPNNEDRRGRMVAYALTDVECTVEEIEIIDPDTHEKKTVEAVVNEKMPPIRYATSLDECIGVISGSGAFIGNSSSEEWNNRFVKDIYGERIKQAILVPEETRTYNVTETDEEAGEEVTVEKTEVIPEHWATQFVLNPHYDPEAEYISREFRQEWDPVGMVGMVVAEDDGTCVVGGYCAPAENGIGTASETGYRVIQRMDSKHVRLYVK